MLSTHRLYCAGIERRCFVYYDGAGSGGGWLGEEEGGGGPEGSLHYLRQEKCSASFTSHGKMSRVGLVREQKYRGVLNAKGRRFGGWGGVNGNLTVSLT